MTKIEEGFINNLLKLHNISKEDEILAGFSGGSDSVCMMLLLDAARKNIGFSLSAVYVEHGIRGEESLRDGNFASDFCNEHGIAFDMVSVDVPAHATKTGKSLEEAARELRYEVLFSKRRQLEAGCKGKVYIAVAHNLRDQAETLIFRMARGTGPLGMTGMKGLENGIIRPILYMDKPDILSFLEEKNQPYCQDSTNFCQDYSRNRIRGQIIPQLLEINAEAVSHIGGLANKMQELIELADEGCRAYLASNVVFTNDGIILLTEGLGEKSSLFVKETVRLFLTDNLSRLRDVSSIHFDNVTELVFSETGRGVDLPWNQRIEKTYQGIVIRNKNSLSSEVQIQPIDLKRITESGVSYSFADYTFSMRIFDNDPTFEIPRENYTKWFDYAKIDDNICIRTRREDDYIIINPDGRQKSLKSYFVDNKIPAWQRDAIPLIACGESILYVAGGRSFEGARITSETTRIIEIKCSVKC